MVFGVGAARPPVSDREDNGDHSRRRRVLDFGGKVSDTNVIPFPVMVRSRRASADALPYIASSEYEFTEKELADLCRWFSAMKYAFPGTEGVMIVSHHQNYSAVGLYNRDGGAPN